ncbi:MAG: SpoIIE family protein phosphatase, partial [Eubacterium sp.]|nr:SpoIIE family protein phosphatase [Eubacterium sp.]
MAEARRKRRLIPRIPRVSMIVQVAILFLVGLVITGWISYVIMKRQFEETVRNQREIVSVSVLYNVYSDLSRYDAHDWLLKYWWDHRDELDVEYEPNSLFMAQTSKKKALELRRKYPDLTLEHVSEGVLDYVFNKHEQKMYAEVFYNRACGHFDDARILYQMDEIYLLVVDDELEEACCLFSGSQFVSEGDGFYTESRIYGLGDEIDLNGTLGDGLRAAFKSDKPTNMYMADGRMYFYYINQEVDDGYTAVFCESFDLEKYLSTVKSDSRNGLMVMLSLVIILSVICGVLLYFFVFRPIRRTRNALRSYTADKDCEAALRQLKDIHTRNEIGQLKDDLSDMIFEMDQYMKEIRRKTAEKERIVTELSVATKIQADMLPSRFPAFPDRSDFDVYATMTPAKAVGGDFYDFFLIDEDHLALVMADVSGKGVPAALFMVISRTLLRNRAMMGGSPAEILEDVNHQLCLGNEIGYFVTVWLAIVELSTGKGLAANAGHEHP